MIDLPYESIDTISPPVAEIQESLRKDFVTIQPQGNEIKCLIPTFLFSVLEEEMEDRDQIAGRVGKASVIGAEPAHFLSHLVDYFCQRLEKSQCNVILSAVARHDVGLSTEVDFRNGTSCEKTGGDCDGTDRRDRHLFDVHMSLPTISSRFSRLCPKPRTEPQRAVRTCVNHLAGQPPNQVSYAPPWALEYHLAESRIICGRHQAAHLKTFRQCRNLVYRNLPPPSFLFSLKVFCTVIQKIQIRLCSRLGLTRLSFKLWCILYTYLGYASELHRIVFSFLHSFKRL